MMEEIDLILWFKILLQLHVEKHFNAAISIQAGNNDFIISHFVCVHKTNDVNNYLSIHTDLAWSQIILPHSHLFIGCETSINESMFLIIIKMLFICK